MSCWGVLQRNGKQCVYYLSGWDVLRRDGDDRSDIMSCWDRELGDRGGVRVHMCAVCGRQQVCEQHRAAMRGGDVRADHRGDGVPGVRCELYLWNRRKRVRGVPEWFSARHIKGGVR